MSLRLLDPRVRGCDASRLRRDVRRLFVDKGVVRDRFVAPADEVWYSTMVLTEGWVRVTVHVKRRWFRRPVVEVQYEPQKREQAFYLDDVQAGDSRMSTGPQSLYGVLAEPAPLHEVALLGPAGIGTPWHQDGVDG